MRTPGRCWTRRWPRWKLVEPFAADEIQAALRAALVDGLGLKPRFAFRPVRVRITGSRLSPPLFESMELLGRESSLTRLPRGALRATLWDASG